jgi:TPR repeat protein
MHRLFLPVVYDTATLQVGVMHMWKTLVDRLLFFKTDSNWYTILYKAAFALFGSTDSFFDEFATVQLSAAAASSASRKANSAALEAVENAIFDKLCKQQRSKLNSRQLHALAELKSSSIVQSLYSVPCLQREQSQSAIQYSIDSSFIFLASRDGSNAEGHVDPDALLLEAAWWWCGVCSGDEDAFDSVIAPRSSIGTLMQSVPLSHKS